MKKILQKFFAFVATSLVPTFCFATGEAKNFVSGMSTEISGMGSTVKTVVLTVIGIVALVYAGINLVKYLRGDGQSQNALIRVVVGVAMALVVVALSGVISPTSGA